MPDAGQGGMDRQGGRRGSDEVDQGQRVDREAADARLPLLARLRPLAPVEPEEGMPVTTKTTAEHAVFRHRAELRGYELQLLDAHGGSCPQSGRPPAGAVLCNPDGDAVWIPVEDLAVVGDQLIRGHVEAGRRAAEVR
jgi:hypothetical protein